MDATLSVFYKLEPGAETVTWKYDRLPGGWRWTGTSRVGDSTASGRQPSIKYTHSADFIGPRRVLYDMIDYLKAYFENLFDLGFLRRYKIMEGASGVGASGVRDGIGVKP